MIVAKFHYQIMKITWGRHPKQCCPSNHISLHLGHAFCSIPQLSMRTYCTIEKSTWTNVAIFFLANFVARAAIVKFVPGESALSAFVAPVFVLLLPAGGNSRDLDAVYQRAVFADTPLKTAARAKALCMVVRNPEWKPQTGDVVETRDYWVTVSSKRSLCTSQTLFSKLQRKYLIRSILLII